MALELATPTVRPLFRAAPLYYCYYYYFSIVIIAVFVVVIAVAVSGAVGLRMPSVKQFRLGFFEFR